MISGIFPWIFVTGLALSPISECRGSIIYGLAVGLNPLGVFIVSAALNAIVAPILFLLFRKVQLMKLAHRIVGKRISRTIESWKKGFEVYEELALMLFVAVPLPLTGAWTATLISEVLDLNRMKASLAIAGGVLIAAVIVFTGTTGVLWLI